MRADGVCLNNSIYLGLQDLPRCAHIGETRPLLLSAGLRSIAITVVTTSIYFTCCSGTRTIMCVFDMLVMNFFCTRQTLQNVSSKHPN